MIMSLSESALKNLSKHKVTIVALEYQKKLDSTLVNINKVISELRQNYEKMHQNITHCTKTEVFH